MDMLKERVRICLWALPIIHHMILDKSFHPSYFNVMTNLKMHLLTNLQAHLNFYL